MLLGVYVCSHSYKVSLLFYSLLLYDFFFLWLNIDPLSVLIYITLDWPMLMIILTSSYTLDWPTSVEA